ncbi:MAG: triple tyrosine motif-containing protein, partial [Flavobacteriales bacterium]
LNKDFTFSFDLSDAIRKLNGSNIRDFLPPSVDESGNLFFACCGDVFYYRPSTKDIRMSSKMPADIPKPTSGSCHTASPLILEEAIVFFPWASNPQESTASGLQEINLHGNNPVYDGSTNQCFADHENTIWFATENGLFRMSDEDVIHEVQFPDHGSLACYQVHQDKVKNIWIATDQGVFYTTQNTMQWDIISLPNVSQSKTVYAQDMVLWNSDLWLNTNESALPLIYKLVDNSLVSFPVNGLEKGVRSLFVWDNQKLFIGGWKHAAMMHAEDNSTATIDFIPEKYREFPIIKTLRDQHNNAWFSFGQYNGILRLNYDRSQSTQFVQSDTIGSDQRFSPISSAYDMEEDAHGNIWMVRSKLDGKFVRWNATTDKIEEIHPANPEAAMMHFNGESYCIDVYGDAIWFAVMREGLFRYDIPTNTLEQFTRNDGLLSNDISALEVDKRGVVWMGTSQGLAAMSYPERTVTHFTSASGLPDQNFSAASLYDSVKDKMYFSANGFVVSFYPEELLRPTQIPELFLTGMRIEGNESGILPRQFHAGENHIDFMFTAVDLYNAEGFEYRYKLEGLESTWNEAGKNKMASYANIPAGDYKLLVSVKTLGVWSEPKALYQFQLPQYFYKTPIFYALMAALFCLFVYAVYWFRIRRIKQMEAIRNRISHDLHDDIGSALSSIRILSGQRKTSEDQNREALQRINRSSQQMLDNMDDIIWAIQPENDSGEQLLIRMREFASEVVEAAGMQCKMNMDERIEHRTFGLNHKRTVYLIFKEAINNAVKYSKASEVSIVFRMTGSNAAYLEVKDNGSGFDTKHILPGNGLKNMKRRAAELGGELHVISSTEKGTSIQLKFELK